MSFAMCNPESIGDTHQINGNNLNCDFGVADKTFFQFYHCDGDVTIVDPVNATCSGDWQQTNSTNVFITLGQSFDISQLDPVLMSAYVGSGFLILVPLWAGCLGIKYLLNAAKNF